MNKALRKYCQQIRQDLQRDCPDIYERFYAHLSDSEMLSDVAEKQRALRASDTIEVSIGKTDFTFKPLGSLN
jgi:thymidylate synthase ThyX